MLCGNGCVYAWCVRSVNACVCGEGTGFATPPAGSHTYASVSTLVEHVALPCSGGADERKERERKEESNSN